MRRLRNTFAEFFNYLQHIWHLVLAWSIFYILVFVWHVFGLADWVYAQAGITPLRNVFQVFLLGVGYCGVLAGLLFLGRWYAQRADDEHRTRKQLRDNEAQFRLFAEFTNDWAYWVAPDDTLRYCAPACERVTGYAATEFVQDPGLIERLVHPDDRPRFSAHKHDDSTRSTQPFDFRIVHRNGKIRWLSHSCQPIYDEHKKFCGIRVSNRDITERQNSEEQLRLHTAALQAAANGVMITDVTGKIVFINNAFTRMTGYVERDVLGRNPREIIKSGKHDKTFYKNLWKTVLAGQVWHGEIVNCKKDGTQYTEEMIITPVRLVGGQVTHLVAVKQDITARKAAELELARAHALLRATLDSSQDAILALGQNGEVATYNQKFLELWRVSDETLTRPLEERLAVHAEHVKNPDEFITHVKNLLASPDQLSTDTLEFKDGRVIERVGTTYRLGGYSVGRLWTFRDVTERKRLERAVQAERDFAMQVINTMGQGLTVTDAEGKFELVNLAYARMFGYRPRDLVGKRPSDVTLLEDHAMLARAQQARLRGETTSYENRLMRADGTVAHVLVTGAPRIKDGRVAGAIAVITDLTEIKRAEQALRESEQRFHLLADTAPVLIWMVDLNGRCTYVSKPWLEFTGYTLEQSLGESWRVCVHPHDAPFCFETMRQAFTQRESFRVEYRLRRADGQYRWMLDTGVPRLTPDGTFAGYIGSCIDITSRKSAEHLLRIQRDLALVLGTANNLNAALNHILDAAFDTGGVDCGGIYIADAKTGALDLAAHHGLPAEFVQAAKHYAPDAPQTRLVNEGKPVYAPYDELTLPKVQAEVSERLRAFATIPVLHNGRVVATLNLASHVHNDIPQPARQALEAIATQIGSVIEHVRTREALSQSQTNLQTLFDALSDMLFILDANGRILHGNPEAQRRLGYTSQELSGVHVLDVHPPEQREQANTIIRAMLAGEETYCPVPLLTKSGVQVPVETKVVPGTWDGQPAIFGISRDVSERLRIETALRESETRFRSIFESSPIAIEVYDAQAQLIAANPACLALFGVTDFELVRGFPLFKDPNMAEEDKARLNAGETIHTEIEFDFDKVRVAQLYPTTKQGLRHLDVQITCLNLNGYTAGAGYLVQLQDISERKCVEARLEYASTHDALTGLYNRAHFENEIDHLQTSPLFPVGVVMVDVDNMKTTNDVHGHLAGDELLRRAAQVLRRAFRAEDVVARIGGDEFAVLLPKADEPVIAQAVERVRHALAAHNAQTRAAPVSFSLGVSTAQTYPDLIRAVQDADVAMYFEKARRHSSN